MTTIDDEGYARESDKEYERELFRKRGKVFETMFEEELGSIVFAAYDHKQLADWILKEWPEQIIGESACEIAIRLLKDYKAFIEGNKNE